MKNIEDWSKHLNTCKSQMRQVSSVGIPLQMQMIHGNLSELWEKVQVSNKVQFSNTVMSFCYVWSKEVVTVYGHAPEYHIAYHSIWGLHICGNILLSTMELHQRRFQVPHSISLFEKLIGKSCHFQNYKSPKRCKYWQVVSAARYRHHRRAKMEYCITESYGNWNRHICHKR